MTAIVYALVCPESGLIRYVGRTKMPLAARMSAHWNHPMRHTAAWMESLRERGLRPIVKLLDEPAIEHASDSEDKWIRYFACRPAEADLLNKTRLEPPRQQPYRLDVQAYGPKRLRRRYREYLNRLATASSMP